MRTRSGFTLIELLVAVAIMGGLVLMAQATYVIYMRDSVEATLRNNLVQIRAAIQQFYADHGRYPFDGLDQFVDPGPANVIGFLDTASSELTQGVRAGSGNQFPTERTRYLMEIPVDPTTNQINWRVLPHDDDEDWVTFEDSGVLAAPNDFSAGEGNGIWDAVEDLKDDTGNPNDLLGPDPVSDRYGRGDGKPTRGEPRVDEDPWVNGNPNSGTDPPNVKDVVSSNRDFMHL